MFKKFEHFILKSLYHQKSKRLILIATMVSFLLSVLMIPTELVLAKMLPGKNNDTFNIYIDLPTGSSISQTQEVGQCIVGPLQQEKEIEDIEIFLGMGSPMSRMA